MSLPLLSFHIVYRHLTQCVKGAFEIWNHLINAESTAVDNSEHVMSNSVFSSIFKSMLTLRVYAADNS